MVESLADVFSMVTVREEGVVSGRRRVLRERGSWGMLLRSVMPRLRM